MWRFGVPGSSTKESLTFMAQQGGDHRRSFTVAPSLADLEALAEQALATLPLVFLARTNNIAIHVVDFPDEETEEEMDLDSPFDLMGLYRGVDLPHQSVQDIRTNLDAIFLYRRPLLDYWCESGEDLSHIVRHVLIHEIGHHFGLSDEDMERIEAEGPDPE
jgi:predicted Zn-dependent protease with MMP-like domain